jgi:bifunctional UDP-N-acetylglucosamine pyrophosphorylase / glucosamine-1-phosphate N-acetyltransferase
MNNKLKEFGIVILAAGQGTRLNCSEMPKVLYKIGGRPILSYILDELAQGGLDKKQIVLVVGFKAELVEKEFGRGYVYALQNKRLGTAHAALTGEKKLPTNFKNFMVLNGDDSAFYKLSSLNELAELHSSKENDLTILTCEPEKTDLGRVVRDANGRVIAIIEKENLTPELSKLKEISTNTFCFRRDWFNNHYPKLKLIAGLNEYGLPSFVEEAIISQARFLATKLKDANEWFGINTPEQLAEADRRKLGI